MISIPNNDANNKLISLKEAQKIILESFPSCDSSICIPASDAAGRILAKPVYSTRTNPPLLLCGPDGIAVKSEMTTGASETNQIELEAPRVNTGTPMPEGFDAVIPIEEVIQNSEGKYKIHTQMTAFQNTVPRGVDIGEGDMVMDTDHYLIPYDVGALLTYGIREIEVKNWKIGLIASGDEIVPPNKNPLPGQIIDSNSYMISAYLKQYGITSVLAPIVSDDPGRIKEEILQLSKKCDIILLFGGSSAGSKDFAVEALKQSGTLLFHGVGMGPGKPASLAKIYDTPVFGMPGPSIASLTALYQLVYPLLKQWGVPIPPDTYIKGEITQPVASFDGFDFFMMVNITQSNGKNLISPVERRFGQMMGVRADAVLHKKVGTQDLQIGDEVEVRMLRPDFTR
nr:molybdopterin molybdotransferase MoeA [uncultured Methanospirillum sp.]